MPISRLWRGWADGGYHGPLVDWAHQHRGIAFPMVQRHDGGRRRALAAARRHTADRSSFAVVPRRRVVQRTFAWLGRYRRLSEDDELLTATPRRSLTWR